MSQPDTLPHDKDRWLPGRKLLWDDDEHVLITDSLKGIGPVRPASAYGSQPTAQYCCLNPYHPGTSRRKENVARHVAFVIEFDSVPVEEQRTFWAECRLPHTVRVFSGNKSIHVFLRLQEEIPADEWKKLARALGRAFPNGCRRTLLDPARLCRLPGGERKPESVRQEVEYVGRRVSIEEVVSFLRNKGCYKGQRDKGTEAQRHGGTEKNSPLSLSLSPPAASVAARIQQARSDRQRYRAEHPGRFRLYETLVERRWTAEPGQRNSLLTQIVPFLFTAVCHDVAMEFVEMFYRFNLPAFHDPLPQHMAEAEHLWRACADGYPSKLSASEREVYAVLGSLDILHSCS